MASLKGVRNIGLRFYQDVDKRSVEKTVGATGAVLGKIAGGEESPLETLEIEISATFEQMDEVSSYLPSAFNILRCVLGGFLVGADNVVQSFKLPKRKHVVTASSRYFSGRCK
jgi:hypothetical protein